MASSLKTFYYPNPFTLENGSVLPNYYLGYHTFGKLNKEKNNVVWVFHALTANSNPTEWWSGLVGKDKLITPTKYFIVCANIPGSCYGSVNPFDISKITNLPYYHNFPVFTNKDVINTFIALKKHLGITEIFIGIGASIGGQQLLEWSCTEPNLFKYIVPIATNAKHSQWGIAFNTTQRMAIEADNTWQTNSIYAGMNGLKTARAIALLSYRNYITYNITQHEESDCKLENFKSESYQKHQGDKISKRFNAFSYYNLTKLMDSHNVGRNRASIIQTLSEIKSTAIVIGIDTDILFPISEQKFIAKHIPNSKLIIIHSNYGHDGFLLEYNSLQTIIKQHIHTI